MKKITFERIQLDKFDGTLYQLYNSLIKEDCLKERHIEIYYNDKLIKRIKITKTIDIDCEYGINPIRIEIVLKELNYSPEELLTKIDDLLTEIYGDDIDHKKLKNL